MLHFGEQLFTAVCKTKYAYSLLGVGDKVEESSRWKCVVLVQIKEETLNLLTSEDQSIPFAVVIVLLYSQHQKAKRKFWKLGVGPPGHI